MRALSIILVAFLMLGAGSLKPVSASTQPPPAPSPPPPSPAGRLILLGARWCAPCMAEYHDLPALVAAAAPDHVVLAWVDRPLPIPPALAGKVSALSPAEARALAERLGGQGFGLPMAALERANHPCPIWKKPLQPQDLPLLQKGC